MIDFHNHLMPGVDDGAANDDEARAGLRALWSEGVRTIVTTPHVDGSLTHKPASLGRRLAELDVGWSRLEAVAAADYSSEDALDIRRGAEVALDTPEPELSEERLRLAGGRFVLVEYPYMTVPPQSWRVIRHIVASGFVPIVAHPERYRGMTTDSHLPQEWREHGALLQITAGAITGRYGKDARDVAVGLLEQGMADFMCSDYHARGKPGTTAARELLTHMSADDHAELLMTVNPARMLEGKAPLPVPPLRVRHTLSDRVRRWLR